MAYYSWKGVDLTGNIKKGRRFAQCPRELDAILIKQEIALLSYSLSTQLFIFNKTVYQSSKIEFFKQCEQLLDAQVLLPDALKVIHSQLHHRQWHGILEHISNAVNEGSSLSQALALYPKVFDAMMINMVHVGEESGRLVESLNLLSDYLHTSHEFRKNMRTAAMVPLVTLGFFIFITITIFAYVIPQFVNIFQSAHQELPGVTRALIAASNFVSSGSFCGVIGLFVACISFIRLAIKTSKGELMWHWFLLWLPGIGFIILQKALAQCMQALAMLTQGGMHIVPALAIIEDMITNKRIRQHIQMIKKEVQAGSSLSQALLTDPGQICGAQAISIIKVGEESGRLPILLLQTARMFQDSIKKKISVITILVNPALMILLGLLIALLVFAVYLPIFSMSNII